MFHIILFQPEIPPNTGNIIRLCANTGAELHVLEPLGFELEDAQLRRAGLDYREWARVHRHAGWDAFRAACPGMRLWGFSTRGETRYDRASFTRGDGLVFGPETRGLPDSLLLELGSEAVLRLPMQAVSRSLNLSNAVAVALFEALRQNDFGDLE